jgi:putative DNA primase/helicase
VAAVAGDTDQLIVSAPGHPMRVAREFLSDRHETEDGHSALRSHRGIFYRWLVTHWAEIDARSVRASLYGWLEDAVYWDTTKKEPTLEPWQPTRMKVANVVEAVHAVGHVDDATEPPCWMFDQQSTRPLTTPDQANVVSVRNGLLDVESRSLRSHSVEFFNHHALDFDFDPAAMQPERWLGFLGELWPDDSESIATLQEMMGYILAGGTEQQKLFLLVGPKRAGKGTMLRVVNGLMGVHNVAAPTLSSLTQNFGLSPLIGTPLAAISDARLGTRSDSQVAVERLLSISGEDAITIDRKYKEPWTGTLPTRFVIVTNEVPAFSDTSGALASRFVILTLTKSFYGREDPGLTNRLLEERSGIFNWALEGLDRLRDRGGFEMPQTSREALRHLEDLTSPVSAFVREECRVGTGLQAEKDELWTRWQAWAGQEGMRVGTKAVFFRDLRAAVPGSKARRLRGEDGRKAVWEGLELQAGQGWSGVGSIVDPTDDAEVDRFLVKHADLAGGAP